MSTPGFTWMRASRAASSRADWKANCATWVAIVCACSAYSMSLGSPDFWIGTTVMR
ncbi:MAG: hypothetical protein ABSF17_05975 [Terracidiphilus sp.]